MNILQINASARSTGSLSTRLANLITSRLVEVQPGTTLTLRDLARTPHPMLDEATLLALQTPADERTPEQTKRVGLDDELIGEIQAADYVVLGVPMYNFGIPVQLKAWIDAIARARVTFRYGDSGVEGLLTGKQVYVALTRGGFHRGTPADVQAAYLKTALGFLGMTEVEFVYAEGLALGPELEQQAFQRAEQEIAALFNRVHRPASWRNAL